MPGHRSRRGIDQVLLRLLGGRHLQGRMQAASQRGPDRMLAASQHLPEMSFADWNAASPIVTIDLSSGTHSKLSRQPCNAGGSPARNSLWGGHSQLGGRLSGTCAHQEGSTHLGHDWPLCTPLAAASQTGCRPASSAGWPLLQPTTAAATLQMRKKGHVSEQQQAALQRGGQGHSSAHLPAAAALIAASWQMGARPASCAQ